MTLNVETAKKMAKDDLAKRLNVSANDISIGTIEEAEFPDMALGASVGGEMAADMISSGWKIPLRVNGKSYEYRADKYQLRLVGFEGTNFLVTS